jgi:aminoglycoside/choline kinase family phosphotransferase
MNLQHKLRQDPYFFPNYANYKVDFLAKDMSVRMYFRITGNNGQSFVLMDAPHPENPSQFVRIADFLRSIGLSTPKVIEKDFENGFLLLEDFGNQTFSKILQNHPSKEAFLYKRAMQTIKHLHNHAKSPPPFVTVYSMDQMVKEACLFLDWYWPHVFGVKIDEDLKKQYQILWKEAFAYTKNIPFSLVLRDFHVDNLMILSDRKSPLDCGLLDFQDAIWGPIVIDIVSLLEDARRDVDASLAQEMWKWYLQYIPRNEHQYWYDCAAILSAGRHLRIIGVFTRYMALHKNPKYLQHLPRLWRLIQKCFNNPNLYKISNWFDKNVFCKKIEIKSK